MRSFYAWARCRDCFAQINRCFDMNKIDSDYISTSVIRIIMDCAMEISMSIATARMLKDIRYDRINRGVC